MTLSKSKRQLAESLIAAGVKRFPEGANWVAQDKCESMPGTKPFNAIFYTVKPKAPNKGSGFWFYHVRFDMIVGRPIELPALIPNWHQTVLSREEFDRVVEESVDLNQYCESVTRSIPDQPTFDQLLQDWRNAADHAARKQDEVDEATAMRDQRWQAVQERAEAFGVSVASGAQK